MTDCTEECVRNVNAITMHQSVIQTVQDVWLVVCYLLINVLLFMCINIEMRTRPEIDKRECKETDLATHILLSAAVADYANPAFAESAMRGAAQ